MDPLFEVAPDDAIGMLIADHKRVARLFAQVKRLDDEEIDEGKAALVERICQELTIHTRLEEEIFYPAAREATQDDDQLDEAWVEHAGAKELIAQLLGASPADDFYDARVTVLNEQIDHHVDEEEGSLFPKVRASRLDTSKLGAEMAARKKVILGGSPAENPPHAKLSKPSPPATIRATPRTKEAASSKRSSSPPKASSSVKRRLSKAKTRGR
jgi:hemerythrin superfamily protein